MLKKILILMSLVLFVAMGFLACSPDDDVPPIDPDNPPVHAFTLKNADGFGFYESRGAKVTSFNENIKTTGLDYKVTGLTGIFVGGTITNPTIYTSGVAERATTGYQHRTFYAEGDVLYPQDEKDGETVFAINKITAKSNIGLGVSYVGGKNYLLTQNIDENEPSYIHLTTFEPNKEPVSKELANSGGTSLEFSSAVMVSSGNLDKAFAIGVSDSDLYVYDVSKETTPERSSIGPIKITAADLEGLDTDYSHIIITDAVAPGDGSEIYVAVVGASGNENLAGIVQIKADGSGNKYYEVAKETENDVKFPYITSLISTGVGKVSYILWTAEKESEAAKYAGPGDNTSDTFNIYLDAELSKWSEKEAEAADAFNPINTGDTVYIVALAHDGGDLYAIGKSGTSIGSWKNKVGSGIALGTDAKLYEFDDTDADAENYPKADFMTKMAVKRN